MSKKWVFEELIQSETDNIGLIAYALYKKEKHQLASSKRDQGDSEESIDQAVTEFHDHAVNTPLRLKAYREQATALMDQIVSGLDEKVRENYEKDSNKLREQLERLKTNHQKEIHKVRNSTAKKAVTDFKNKVSSYPVVGRGKRFWGWTVSGFAGIWAAFILGSFFLLIASWGTNEEERKEMVRSFIIEYVEATVE